MHSHSVTGLDNLAHHAGESLNDDLIVALSLDAKAKVPNRLDHLRDLAPHVAVAKADDLILVVDPHLTARELTQRSRRVYSEEDFHAAPPMPTIAPFSGSSGLGLR